MKHHNRPLNFHFVEEAKYMQKVQSVSYFAMKKASILKMKINHNEVKILCQLINNTLEYLKKGGFSV